MSQPQGQQQRAIPQSKEALLKSYSLKLREDVKSMLDNFTEIIKLARIEEESQVSRATQAEQDQYEMQVRAANIIINECKMQSAQRELRSLLQEETALINLASKISDQLNRLKVEELALQNLVRIQNEEQERHLRGSMSAGSSKMLEEQDKDKMEEEAEEDSNKVDLDLSVANQKKWKENIEEEEEEEEEEETYEKMTTSMHYDIEEFVEQL